MKHISSRDNPAVKALVKLAGLAGRRGASVLLDGVHLCRAWLDHHGLPEQAVFDAERLDQPELAALAAALPSERCLALDARLMQSLASVESGQGVAFVVAPPAPALPGAVDENCVLFDRIQDPGNVGTFAAHLRGGRRQARVPGHRHGRRLVARCCAAARARISRWRFMNTWTWRPCCRACARRWWRRRWTAPATCTALHCRRAAPGCSDMKGRAWTRACWPPRP